MLNIFIDFIVLPVIYNHQRVRVIIFIMDSPSSSQYHVKIINIMNNNVYVNKG